MTVSEPIQHVERAVSDAPIARLARRRSRRAPRSDDTLMGMALLLGPANVIMQDVARQRRFDRLMAVLRTVNNLIPPVHPLFPVQRAAVGSGPADQDRPAAGVAARWLTDLPHRPVVGWRQTLQNNFQRCSL